MDEPNERVVVITGANRGIGRAIARRFAAEGWRVVGTYRAEPPPGEDIAFVRCDIAHDADVAAFAALLRERFGRVDVLINNAAIFERADYTLRADEVDGALVRRTLDVNVAGTIAVTVALLPLVPRGGRVINLSSDLGQFSQAGGMTPTMTAYSLSKAALNAYTAALGGALRERGIFVASIHPGWTKTAMGGEQAPRTPEDAAADIYALALRSDGETGRFWIGDSPATW